MWCALLLLLRAETFVRAWNTPPEPSRLLVRAGGLETSSDGLETSSDGAEGMSEDEAAFGNGQPDVFSPMMRRQIQRQQRLLEKEKARKRFDRVVASEYKLESALHQPYEMTNWLGRLKTAYEQSVEAGSIGRDVSWDQYKAQKGFVAPWPQLELELPPDVPRYDRAPVQVTDRRAWAHVHAPAIAPERLPGLRRSPQYNPLLYEDAFVLAHGGGTPLPAVEEINWTPTVLDALTPAEPELVPVPGVPGELISKDAAIRAGILPPERGLQIPLQPQDMLDKEMLIAERTLEILCRNKVAYWGMAGTLLGALRHGGMMQWDDDVDVLIPWQAINAISDLDDQFEAAGLELWTKFNTATGLSRFQVSLSPELAATVSKDLRRKDMVGIPFLDIIPVEPGKDGFQVYSEAKDYGDLVDVLGADADAAALAYQKTRLAAGWLTDRDTFDNAVYMAENREVVPFSGFPMIIPKKPMAEDGLDLMWHNPDAREGLLDGRKGRAPARTEGGCPWRTHMIVDHLHEGSNVVKRECTPLSRIDPAQVRPVMAKTDPEGVTWDDRERCASAGPDADQITSVGVDWRTLKTSRRTVEYTINNGVEVEIWDGGKGRGRLLKKYVER